MNQPIENQGLKIFSAWAVVGITSWSEAAAFLGACYTALLITEWFWKRLWRPMLVRKGYLMPVVVKAPDADE